MKIHALMYHDVFPRVSESGFRGADADRYKHTPAQFAEHLAAIAAATDAAPIVDVADGWMITFDDGGCGAMQAADALDQRNWRGLFFITTDCIGQTGFVDAPQIAELHRRGHIVGTHSTSHPGRIAHTPAESILREWRDSTARLADIIGHEITTASVPGGYYSGDVADQAAAAGIRLLFNSEPTSRVRTRGPLRVVGRYTIMGSTSPQRAARLAAGDWAPRFQQAVAWNLRKAAKFCGGNAYLALRRRFFESRG